MRGVIDQDMALLGWIVVAAAATAVEASGWQQGQVSATMCKWNLARVGVMTDTAYIDGGYLYWQPGMNDGSIGVPEPDDTISGTIWALNFSVPFKFSDNISTILEANAIYKGANKGAVNNLFPPPYVDGALFSNAAQMLDYGGLTYYKESYPKDPPQDIFVYQQSWYGAAGKAFKPGFLTKDLPNGTTRHVTSGGAISVPSENLAFYFSGSKNNMSADGIAYLSSFNPTLDINALSDTLITVDMKTQDQETFTNDTLPSIIEPRAGSQLAFVPVGEQGILVAIGGVTEPIWDEGNGLSQEQIASSSQKSLKFVSQIAVYDINGKKWYTQLASSPPSTAMANGCTIVASAADGSSHNIYWYGGTDGLKINEPYSDAVWVLSVPAFEWIQIAQGDDAKHGRTGHRCVKPYPDQMIVIGGDTPAGTANGPPTCLKDLDGKEAGGMIQGFNLSSGQWMTQYDPRIWSEYAVPAAIYQVIGGNAQGGATRLSPANGTWDDSGLGDAFATKYDTSKIKNFYPYAVKEPGQNTSRPGVDPSPTSVPAGNGGTPKWLAPVLGVVLGLIFISALVVAILLYRRRRYFKTHPHSETDGTSEANRGRILSWVKGSGPGADPKSPTTLSATASVYNNSGTDVTSSGRARAFSATSQGTTERAASPLGQDSDPVEAGGSVIHELADTSAIQELSATGTGMAYIGPQTPKSALARNPSTQTQGADGNGRSPSTDGANTWNSGGGTNGSGTGTWGAQSSVVSPSTPRPDSPGGVFGSGGNPLGGNPAWSGEKEGGTHMSISPPTPKREGSDYLSAKSAGGSGRGTPQTGNRKSAFGEHFDEKS